jgi:hypothetical protein
MRSASKFVILAAGLIGLNFGCASTGRSPAGAAEPLPEDVLTSSGGLIEFIGNQPFVTAELGYRAAYAMAEGEMFAGDYAALQSALVQLEIARSSWDLAPDQPLRRGQIGYLLCKSAGITSGFNWNLLGGERYAYRELVYLGIVRPAGEYGLMSGGEFQGALIATEEHLAEGQTSAVRLGPRQ